MPTTSDYLTQLEQDREDLVDNLETKGITGLSGDETFTELVPEVLNIPSGGGLDWRAIGYSEEPETIQDGYDYAVEIKNNWSNVSDLSSKFTSNYNLIFMPLVETSQATTMRGMFQNCYNLMTIPLLNMSNVTNMQNMFRDCRIIDTIPLLNTSNIINMSYTFSGCEMLKNCPVLNTSSVTNMQNMFSGCDKLSDESLNNILEMCINVNPSYSRAKTLVQLGFSNSYYTASKIQSLSKYQDFIDAGWTIGY